MGIKERPCNRQAVTGHLVCATSATSSCSGSAIDLGPRARASRGIALPLVVLTATGSPAKTRRTLPNRCQTPDVCAAGNRSLSQGN
jgi:hypothetical protein